MYKRLLTQASVVDSEMRLMEKNESDVEEVMKKAYNLYKEAGAGYIRHGQLDAFVIGGAKGHLQVKFVYHGGQGNAVGFNHGRFILSFLSDYYTCPVVEYQPKKFFEKTEKKTCFFRNYLLLYSSACDRRIM